MLSDPSSVVSDTTALQEPPRRLVRALPSLACPDCGGSVERQPACIACTACGRRYEIREGKIYFSALPERRDSLDSLKGRLKKRLGKAYYTVGVTVFAPTFPFNFRKHLCRWVDPSENLVIDIGAGGNRVDEEVITLDLFDYDSVDIVCELTAIPFRAESVDAVVSRGLLEHLSDLHATLCEVRRVTRSGGVSAHLVPFLYPYHASPDDFQRFTHSGLSNLFKGWTREAQFCATGPMTLLLVCLAEFLSIVLSFGQQKLRAWTYLLVCLLLFPIKFLDLPFVNHSTFVSLAPTIFGVYRKP